MLEAIFQELENEGNCFTHVPSNADELKETGKTILIAEDDDLIRKSFTRILASKGFNVIEAENGSVALSRFRQERPALVLTDLRMPKKDGFELLEDVYNESPNTPVIIISGVGTKADIINALRSGAWDYILKPVEDMNYLIDTIDRVLAQSEMNNGYHDLMEKALQNKNAELEKELKQKKMLENQLLQSKKEWENTVDSIPEAIALFDRNSLLIRVNMAMADLLGNHPAQLIGEACYLSTQGFNNKQQAMKDYQDILKGRRLKGKFKTDDHQHYEVSISPYYDHNDRIVVGAVYVARNVSQ